MAADLIIDVDNTPGAPAEVAAAISDAGGVLADLTRRIARAGVDLHLGLPS